MGWVARERRRIAVNTCQSATFRRRRRDQAGQGASAAVHDDGGEFDGIADAQHVRRQLRWADGKAADGTGESGQLTFPGSARTFSSTGSDSSSVYWGRPPGMVVGPMTKTGPEKRLPTVNP